MKDEISQKLDFDFDSPLMKKMMIESLVKPMFYGFYKESNQKATETWKRIRKEGILEVWDEKEEESSVESKDDESVAD